MICFCYYLFVLRHSESLLLVHCYMMNTKIIESSTSITWRSSRHQQKQPQQQQDCPPDLRFLHFNDVYHIEYIS